MTTFILISGLISLGVGLILLFATDGEDGATWVIMGIILILVGGFFKLVAPDIKEIPKTETIATDSIHLPKDSIGDIMFVISWKDEDGVWAGQNVKIRGRIDKNIGDTIIVKMPN